MRLIGIDTPEVYGGLECGGRGASKSMKRKLDRGDRVNLIKDFSQDLRDRYGRLLRHVERRDRDVGKRQVANGWAKVYVYGNNPFKRVRSIAEPSAGPRPRSRRLGPMRGSFPPADLPLPAGVSAGASWPQRE